MIVVGATTVAWKCDGTEELAWLTHAEQMATTADVRFVATLEQDARGDIPFQALLDRLDSLGGDVWRYRYDDQAETITAKNRIRRICAGRNMLVDYAIDAKAEWILHLDTDLTPDPDCIPKLLEVDWPIVGGDVPSYCLSGETLEAHPCKVWLEVGQVWPQAHPARADGVPFGFPVQRHWNTAGFLLVHRSLFRRLRWRVDPDAGMTDDPCYAQDALMAGWPTLVRKDAIGRHATCAPMEARGLDLRVYR